MVRSLDILVVEDEMLVSMDLEATLRGMGHAPRLASDLAAARREIEAGLPDLALLDINLGGGPSGFEVGRILLDRGCDIMFVSGYTEAIVPLPDEFHGVPRLAKPFDRLRLAALLAELG
jgi:DNA-binding response OmpR family regulator